MAVGMRQRVEFDTDYVVITPLRHVLPAFGLSLEIRSAAVHRDEDPLVRRMRMFAQKKKGESKQAFRVTGDFSTKSEETVEISLPGDDILAAILLLAKSLVQKGTLLIENAPVDSWALPILSLMRKMGCRPGIQEEGSTSFGMKGIVQPQLFDIVGRKTECVPFWQYREQLGPMIVLSCFAKGQSVFRRLEELRCDSPDRVLVLLSVVRLLGARHGEMPDGIVVDGAKQFDGFDLADVLPAPVAGACAVAGFRCAGKTTVEDKSILERWPSFGEMLAKISTYRT
jgi:3-phosphoshikimate 1-carboxyvinyltransferase